LKTPIDTSAQPVNYYPLWKVFLTTLLIATVLITGGQLAGRRFFWTDFDLRRIDREIEHFRQMVDSEPANPQHRVDLGYSYFRRGQYGLALTQYDEAIALDSGFMPAYLSRGLAYFQLGHYNEALASFVRVTELAPEDYRGHLNAGIAYQELKMYQEAAESLFLARRYNPAAAEVPYQLGVLFERQGLTDAALESYNEALAINPQLYEALQATNRLQLR